MKELIVALYVKTNASTTELGAFNEERNAYEFIVSEVPENGRANDAIVRYFTKHFKCTARVKTGFTSRKKLLSVSVNDLTTKLARQ
ncbi:MAG TPA: DUF167 domain-containing protein [Acidobacteriota bacterium]|nr:DUF167 domain-containing protein [Acidobacteriota bacterium]